MFFFVILYICLWTKKIFESYFSVWLTFSNIRSRTFCQIYRLVHHCTLQRRSPHWVNQGFPYLMLTLLYLSVGWCCTIPSVSIIICDWLWEKGIFAQTMIFRYKRCCSKKLNMWQTLRKGPTSDTKWFFSTSVFSLRNLKQKILTSIFFAKLVSPNLCLHSRQIWKTGSPSKRSSALLEGRHLNFFSTLKPQ